MTTRQPSPGTPADREADPDRDGPAVVPGAGLVSVEHERDDATAGAGADMGPAGGPDGAPLSPPAR